VPTQATDFVDIDGIDESDEIESKCCSFIHRVTHTPLIHYTFRILHPNDEIRPVHVCFTGYQSVSDWIAALVYQSLDYSISLVTIL